MAYNKETGLSHKYEIGNEYIYNNKKFRIVGVFIKNEKMKDKKRNTFKVWYKVFCYECGGIFTTDNAHIGTRGCAICKGSQVYEGINDIPTTAPWMIPYFPGGYNEAKLYTRSSNVNIKMICPNCGRESELLISPNRLYKTHSIGCICGSNNIKYPERLMYSLLNQLKIHFILHAGEKKIGFPTSKEYDFYLPDYNCIIETHGRQHYKGYNGTWGSYEEIHKNDIFKEMDAKKHGIANYIIIDCRESELQWIKNNIINSNLPNILSFTEADNDWQKCEEDAQKNIIKNACDYYNKNYMNIANMSNNLLLYADTLERYLRKGNELGWCCYNKNHNTKYPCVAVYKDNYPLILAKNVQYLAKNSNKILRKNLLAKGIIKCLRNECHTYCGYTFKYYREPADICWEANKNGYIDITGGDYSGYFKLTDS